MCYHIHELRRWGIAVYQPLGSKDCTCEKPFILFSRLLEMTEDDDDDDFDDDCFFRVIPVTKGATSAMEMMKQSYLQWIHQQI